MKICTLQAIISFAFCSLAVAHNNYGQVLDQKISISLRDVSIEEVLESIEHLTNVKFFYSVDQLDIKDKVSVEAVDRSLRNILDELLAPYKVRYKVHEKKLTITLKKEGNEKEFDSGSDDRHENVDGISAAVTGKVTDAKSQQPMAGVNILIKGTNSGTSSDAKGEYAINASDTDILVFSFIGYNTVEEPVGNRTVIEIVMQEDATTLPAVTLNGGYYTTTEKKKTGNIAKVTANEINGQPVSNTLQALQGRMAGVEIIQLNGVPGAAMKIQIRGQNSLREEGNYPMYIIDGVPVISQPIPSHGALFGGIDPLNTINAENIESIEILKDADATAIYGSRGANGVVLITTKSGTQNAIKTSLDISYYAGAGRANQIDDLMDSQQYLEMRRLAIANDGSAPQPWDYDLTAWDTTRHTNWQDVLFGGTAYISDAQIALSGGNPTTSFRVGAGYHKETTVFPGDFGFERLSASLHVNHTSINKKMKVHVSVNYGVDDNNLFDLDIVNTALNLPPVAPAVHDENGDLNWQLVDGASTWSNPFAPLRVEQRLMSNNLLTNAVCSYEIFPGLIIKANMGYSTLSNNETIIRPISSYDPTTAEAGKVNQTQITKNQNTSWIAEPQISYSKILGQGIFDGVIGTTWQSTAGNIMSILGSYYTGDALLGGISAAREIRIVTDANNEYRYNAAFARIGYNWREKYIINLTGRHDGSSRFGPENRFANFGAVGLAWLISNEKFFLPVGESVSFAKLRTSYGSTGSDQIGNYGYFDVYTSTEFNYEDVKGLYPSALANPGYAWEVNKKYEAALELGLFNDKVLLTTSWYNNRSSNQLVGYPLPSMTGFRSVIANFDATVENTGWEFSVNSTNLQSEKLKWTSSVNLTIPRNRLLEYPNIEGSSYADKYIVGEPLNIARLYHMAGVDPQTGLYMFEDLNQDGNYSMEDRYVVRDLGRRFYGGFLNQLAYEGFSFGFLIEFSKQQGVNEFAVFDEPGSFNSGAQPVNRLKNWRKEGDVAAYQKFSQYSGTYFNALQSDAAFDDASFLRLKTVSLEYNFHKKTLRQLGLNSAKVYIRGQNLITITNFAGLDPQSPYNNLPALKMVTGGLHLVF